MAGARLILTSNLAAYGGEGCLFVDYGQCVNEDGMVSDNAGLMLLKLLERCGARQVFLAGFDGFAPSRRPATTAGKPSCPSTPRSFSSASAAWGNSCGACPWRWCSLPPRLMRTGREKHERLHEKRSVGGGILLALVVLAVGMGVYYAGQGQANLGPGDPARRFPAGGLRLCAGR